MTTHLNSAELPDLENNFEITMKKQEMFYINFNDHISNPYD